MGALRDVEQQIGFCTASDGVRIAYATLGEGTPLVYVCGFPGHLELEWEKPFARALLEALAEGCMLIRYDMRGSGLSDRDVTDLSLDVLTRDLEVVTDHHKLERFALLSLGQLAGPIAMTYAASHPHRVSHLILNSAFLRGDAITTPQRRQAILEYVGQFGVPLDLIAAPTITTEEQRDMREILQLAASRETGVAITSTLYSADVTGVVDRLTMPVLILHGRQDRGIPFRLGRELAARLPQAKFVPFEGNSGVPGAVSHIIIPEIHAFMGIEGKAPEIPGASAQGLVTILFTDVEGSTALTERLGDAPARELLRTHERIIRDQLTQHGGTEVKTTGDGFMATFPSASRALECAIALQRAFAAYEREHPETHVRVRVGLNAGEPIAEADDLFGTAVNLAARIAGQARGGEILASDVVRQLAAGKGFLFAERGETALRGFEDPVRVYEVGWQG